MKNKKLILNAFTVLFVIVLITWFTELNYQDLSFKNNLASYFGIISMSSMIIAMQLTKKSLKGKNE